MTDMLNKVSAESPVKAFADKRRPAKNRCDYQETRVLPSTLMIPNSSGPGHDKIAIRIEGRVERAMVKPAETDDGEKQVRIMKITR